MAVVGLGTCALSLVTYALYGAAILRTDASSRPIGFLLLAAAGALIAVFSGQMAFNIELIGTIVETALFVFSVSIGYRLRTETSTATRHPVTDPTT